MSDWFKLHRKIIEWEWYTDGNTMRVFIHCILEANYEAKRWQGINIPRGSFPTSLEALSQQLKLSIQQVRTSLDKLIRTGEITKKANNHFTLLTVNQYEKYQENNTPSNIQNNKLNISSLQELEDIDNIPDNIPNNRQITDNQQTDNRPITTPKEIKNIRNKEIKKEEEEEDIIPSLFLEVIQYLNEKTGKHYKHTIEKTKKLIRARMNEGFQFDDFKKVIDNKVKDWSNDPVMEKFLRPETLFSNKFEGYLNENEVQEVPAGWQDLRKWKENKGGSDI